MSDPQITQVTTNAFPIIRIPTKEYHMYDVVFTPEVEQRSKKIQLFQHLQVRVMPSLFNPRLVYDGQAIAYSPGLLNLGGNSGATFTINLGSPTPVAPGSKGSFQIRLTVTSSDPINPDHVHDLITHRRNTPRAQVATNLIQLVIRQGPNQNFTNNGRAYFTGHGRSRIRESGIELWPGIWQSVRPTIGRMILNIDTCTAAVYQHGPLIDIAMDFLKLRDVRALDLAPNDQDFRKLEKFLKKLRIKVTTGQGRSRIKTIRGLVSRAGEFAFMNDDTGRETTVQRHFQEAHGIRVERPKIFGVRLTGKNSPHQDVVPAELCIVEMGQLFKQKLPDAVVPQMVKFAAMRPQERLKKIVEGANDYHKSEFVAESGMQVDTRPMTIDALRLVTPAVRYKNGNVVPGDGKWNVVGKILDEAKPLLSWAIINFCSSQIGPNMYGGIVNGIMNCCRNLGMQTQPPHFVVPGNPGDPVADLNKAMAEITNIVKGDKKALEKTVLIILLPVHGGVIRNAVKNWGDIGFGVTTNCLRQDKLMKANDQYWNNIALKLNARLGGRNSRGVSQVLNQLEREPFIIMGADVGHPGPGVQKPSVTSLVYSHDVHATQYAAITGIQAPRLEYIENLHDYVATAVVSFGDKNRASPKRVIFFRDGLSEGEFEQVAGMEISAIKKAFESVWARRKIVDPLPKLTFVVVGKRHHATFYPTTRDAGDRTGNCHPGTVIESGITHPAIVDFYLQSHAAIQGTSRSSHYIVLHDEIFDKNTRPLQDLAYALCHVYAKATRSVSIPAPVYYADSVCSRLAFHMDAASNLGFDDGASITSSSSTFDLDAWKLAFRPTHQRINKNMYFL